MPKLVYSTPKLRKRRRTLRDGRKILRAEVTIAGQVFDLGPWNSKESRLEYHRRLVEWEKLGRTADPDKLLSLTIVELIDRYFEFARGRYRKGSRPTSEYVAIKAALRPLNEWYGRSLAAEFGPLKLEALQERMHQPVIDGGCNWSRGVVNQNIGRIRRMFKKAVAWELIPVTVWQALRSVEGLSKGRTTERETAPVLPVEADVVEATIPYLPPLVADMVRLQQLTGCRPGEICILRPCDVDTTGKVWRYAPASHKTEHHGRGRVIFFGPQAQDVLRPYLVRDKSGYCFSPLESERQRLALKHEKRVTPPHYGNRPGMRWNRRKRRFNDRYCVDAYRRAIERAVELANRDRKKAAEASSEFHVVLPRWAPNQLRHTKATEIRARFGIDAAATVLGHSKPDTTLIYAEQKKRALVVNDEVEIVRLPAHSRDINVSAVSAEDAR